jgi:uncharacterized RDD family membrane protein YckC
MGDGADTTDPQPRRRRPFTDPLGRLLDVVVPNVVDAIDVDDVVAQVDLDALLERADVNALLDRVDVNALLERVDVNALLDRVDVNALLDRADVDALLLRADVNALLDRVDVNALLDRADVDALLLRADVNALTRRIDIDAIVASIDLDAALARVDLDRAIDRVDVDHVMQRADVAGIVARSTRGLTARTLDLARRQLVGIDEIVTRVAARLVRRDPAADPSTPPALRDDVTTIPHRGPGSSISGHYAGPLARTTALVVDTVALVFLFGAATALASWTAELLLRRGGNGMEPPWSTAVFVAWALTYHVAPLAITGRTPGKALVGLRVVRRDGEPLRLRQAVVRVLVLPVSLALLGIGFVGAAFGRERRTLHDLAAGSVVVTDWGDRAAELPTPIADWLARRQASMAQGDPVS